MVQSGTAGNIFQRKIDKLIHGLPIVFGIVNAILIASFDHLGRDHDETVDKILQSCRKAYLELNKENHATSFLPAISPLGKSFHGTATVQISEN